MPLPDVLAPGVAEPAVTERPERAVLLVDDDAAVRRVTARYLALLGYTVIEAANAEEALAVSARDGRIDLVLSDIALPGIRGPALLQELRVRRPDVPAVLMSGFAPEALHPASWPAGTGFLTKPFDLSELRLSLRRYCDGSAVERR